MFILTHAHTIPFHMYESISCAPPKKKEQQQKHTKNTTLKTKNAHTHGTKIQRELIEKKERKNEVRGKTTFFCCAEPSRRVARELG